LVCQAFEIPSYFSKQKGLKKCSGFFISKRTRGYIRRTWQFCGLFVHITEGRYDCLCVRCSY